MPDDDMTVTAAPKTTGQRIDELIAEIPKLEDAVRTADEAADRCRVRYRNRLLDLVELVGRPTAASLLKLTPRALAGKLR